MSNLDEIRQRLRGAFRPFTLHLSDGRKFHVPHQDFIAVGQRVVIYVDERDLSNVIDALHIVSLEEDQSEPTRGVTTA